MNRDHEQWIREREQMPPKQKASGWNKVAAWAVGTVVLVVLLLWAASCDGNRAKPAPRGSGGVVALPVPTTPIGTPPVASIPSLAPVVPEANPPGPSVDGVGEGVYEVGPDMTAGKYRTSGPDPADSYPNCYFARLKHNDGSVGDIIQNDNLKGQGVVTVRDGEYFQTTGCATWVKQAK